MPIDTVTMVTNYENDSVVFTNGWALIDSIVESILYRLIDCGINITGNLYLPSLKQESAVVVTTLREANIFRIPYFFEAVFELMNLSL